VNILLLDTNVVSVIFNKNHSLRQACLEAVAGRNAVISFMTLAELMLWPVANHWGELRRTALAQHLALYTTLYPDERTCAIWAEIVDGCRRSGQPIQTADAWIASAARQWHIPLVTADFRDYAAIAGLEIVPIPSPRGN
jgi:predicted nucleic acid-binding protein